MSFAHPQLLLILAAVPVALAIWAWGMTRGRRAARRISRQPTARAPFLAAVLAAAAAALAILAAAQPRWGEQESFIPRQGAQLVFVVDVSRSMSARDIAPSRLEATKTAIDATLARLGGDRVGLVIFAGSARLRIPLTTDFAAASQVLRSLETGPILVEKGTDASTGIDVAIGAFDLDLESGKLIVLITDGDDLGADPAGAAQRVRDAGIDLIVVGAATTGGAPIPVFDPATRVFKDKLDASGTVIVTKLNETFLRALAAAAGGRYLGGGLTAIPGTVDGRLVEMKRARFERQAATFPVERYQWFAGAALACLVLAGFSERLRFPGRRVALGLAAAAFMAFAFSACETAAHGFNERAVQAFKRGEYAEAERLFLEARAERPNDPRVSLNLARALHAQERYPEAALAARGILVGSRNAALRGQAQAAIGHSRFATNDLEGALSAFREALIENPADGASRHDYEVVLRLLTPPPPPPPPPPADATPTPSADGSETPGETPTPGPGGADPSATPGPVGPPAAGATPPPGNNPPGAGPPSQPQDPRQLSQRITEIQGRIQQLVEDAAGNPTAAQALQILDLLAEQQRLTGVRDALSGGGDPKDY